MKSCEVATIRLAYALLDAGNEDRSVAFRAQPGAEPAQSNQSPPLQRTSPNRCDPKPGPARSGRTSLGLFQAGWKPRPAKIRSRHPDDPCLDPLYLFACGLSWRKQCNAGAGWELVACLKSVRADRADRSRTAGAGQKFRVTGSGPGACQGRAGRPPPQMNRQTGCEQGGGNHEYPVRAGNYRELCLLQAAQRQVVLWPVFRGAESPSAQPAI